MPPRRGTTFPALAWLLTATLVGCVAVAPRASPETHSPPPSPQPVATPSPSPTGDECFSATLSVEPIHQTIENMLEVPADLIVGTFRGHGKGYWDTPDGQRPTPDEYRDEDYMIFTPVLIDIERVIRGEEWSAQHAVEWGGWVGCDNVHSAGRLDLAEGRRYLFWLMPRTRNGEPTGDAGLVEAWAVNRNDIVATRYDGDIALAELLRVVNPPDPEDEPFEQPPVGRLQVGDGEPIEGRLGSWCYGTACADSIPGDVGQQPRLELSGPGATIVFTLPPPHRFVFWRVDYATDADQYPYTLLAEGGAQHFDPDGPALPSGVTPIPELESVSFAGPRSGSWLLAVHVQFAEMGDAVYYWYVVVP